MSTFTYEQISGNDGIHIRREYATNGTLIQAKHEAHSFDTVYYVYTSTTHYLRSSCSLCGYIKKGTTENHSWVYYPPSSTYNRRQCSVCGIVQNTTPLHTHSYSISYNQYNSSYHYKVYTCSCGDSYSELQSHSQGSPSAYNVPTLSGCASYSYCTKCSHPKYESEIPHVITWGEWQRSTVNSDYLIRYRKPCTRCGATNMSGANSESMYSPEHVHDWYPTTYAYVNPTTHRWTRVCKLDSSHVETGTESHTDVVSGWTPLTGDFYHIKTSTCSRCNYSRETHREEHFKTISDFIFVNELECESTESCNICSYNKSFKVNHNYVSNGNGTKTCSYCGTIRALLTPWSWTSNVSQGGNMNVVSIGGVNHPSPLTATEWNNFTSFVNELRVAKGHSTYSYASVSPNTNFMAWIFNEAYNQINYMNPPTALPTKPVSGGQILASHINGIKDSVNSLI